MLSQVIFLSSLSSPTSKYPPVSVPVTRMAPPAGPAAAGGNGSLILVRLGESQTDSEARAAARAFKLRPRDTKASNFKLTPVTTLQCTKVVR